MGLSGLAWKAKPPPTRNGNRDSGTVSAIRLRSEAMAGQDGDWLRRLLAIVVILHPHPCPFGGAPSMD